MHRIVKKNPIQQGIIYIFFHFSHIDASMISFKSAGTVATLYDDLPNFDIFNFPRWSTTITLSAQLFFKTFSSRGSSYKVVSGGWVLYSEPNYQGKATYQFGGELDENSQSEEVVIDSLLHIISKSGPITFHFGIERFQNNWAPRKQWRCHLIF